MKFERIKPLSDTFNEECGVFGIFSDEEQVLAKNVYLGLYALQHRGQDSGGIAVACGEKIVFHKSTGLIQEVFAHGELDGLPQGNIALGHVRYGASGKIMNAQPLVFTGKCGMTAVASNGVLINDGALRKNLIDENVVFQTSLNTEIIAYLVNKYSGGDIVKGVLAAAPELLGAFSFAVMTNDKLVAVRDPHGVRPFALGKISGGYVISSESCGLDAAGADFIRDIEPGEVLVISREGLASYELPGKGPGSCIFEYVYLARSDSVIDGCSVYEARKESGRILAKKYPVQADIVSGVPDSAVPSARGFSEVSGIPYVEALEKNRYVGRSFIQHGQNMRENTVSIKMNVLRANVKGKRVILVDDSIVRGTTSKKIVEILKQAGAREVHLRISSPPVKHTCPLGIDIKNEEMLIGARKTESEINEWLGSDSLRFLTEEDLLETVKTAKNGFCTGCFNGKYPY